MANLRLKAQIKAMQQGERFKIEADNVRKLQLLTWYYRSLCKTPVNVYVVKGNDGYYCERLAYGGKL